MNGAARALQRRAPDDAGAVDDHHFRPQLAQGIPAGLRVHRADGAPRDRGIGARVKAVSAPDRGEAGRAPARDDLLHHAEGRLAERLPPADEPRPAAHDRVLCLGRFLQHDNQPEVTAKRVDEDVGERTACYQQGDWRGRPGTALRGRACGVLWHDGAGSRRPIFRTSLPAAAGRARSGSRPIPRASWCQTRWACRRASA